ncbi:uncharacterized protein LOC133854936 isoform X2 [Alnus glutinosa]|uniref:uncharacterized protein LOC133854936 isoform X2 n=1 Tax=Alnus glutinosa TaxID=3517 RepID=UPI002D798A73|nr:uncharacterized protein LOC133854936 isoform X2 [Alnus glutinosa]
MMSSKSMIKLMLVIIMEFIILMILEVHANDPISLSPTPTALPTSLHLFELDNGDISYFDRCIESTLKKCGVNQAFFIAKNLLECLFEDPMHPKDYPISLGGVIIECFRYCHLTWRHIGFRSAECIVNCYKEKMKRNEITVSIINAPSLKRECIVDCYKEKMKRHEITVSTINAPSSKRG